MSNVKARWKLVAYFGGYCPVATYMVVQSVPTLLAQGMSFLPWFLFGITIAVSCHLFALATWADHPYMAKHRDNLILAYLVFIQVPAFIVDCFCPQLNRTPAYLVEGAFTVAATVLLEMPLRHTLALSFVAMPVFGVLTRFESTRVVSHGVCRLRAAPEWSLREQSSNAAAIVGALLVAPVLMQVAWYKHTFKAVLPAPLPKGASWQARTVRWVQYAVLAVERRLLECTALQNLDSWKLVAAVCYPQLALAIYNQTMYAFLKTGQCSPPFEQLLSLISVAVLASTEHGILGLKALSKLRSAQELLDDVFPSHIVRALGMQAREPDGGPLGAEAANSLPTQARKSLEDRAPPPVPAVPSSPAGGIDSSCSPASAHGGAGGPAILPLAGCMGGLWTSMSSLRRRVPSAGAASARLVWSPDATAGGPAPDAVGMPSHVIARDEMASEGSGFTEAAVMLLGQRRPGAGGFCSTPFSVLGRHLGSALRGSIDWRSGGRAGVLTSSDSSEDGSSSAAVPGVEAQTGSSLRQSGGTDSAGSANHTTSAIALGTNLVHALAQRHEDVTVLFADLVGFTSMVDALEPVDVMAMLHDLYTRFDLACDPTGVYKVETIGDCYMAAAGLFTQQANHAEQMLRFAFHLLDSAQQVLVPYGDQPLMLRIGMHSGCVTSGVVGKMRKRYCLFGSTVNVASRMEHTARHGTIQVSAATWLQLAHLPGICWEKREVNVKGKGPMVTYTVTSYDRALLGLSYL